MEKTRRGLYIFRLKWLFSVIPIPNRTTNETIMIKKTPQTVILLNFGCPDIQQLARAIRAQHIYTMVMPWTTPVERVMQEEPVGLILCRKPQSKEHPQEREAFAKLGIPLRVEEGEALDAAGAIAFCKDECGCQGLWRMESFLEEAVEDVRKQVGDKRVILGLSGGVDSSVCAALIHRAIGKQLTCVFVNHGLLRLGEPEQVQSVFRDTFDMNLVYIDASDRFLDKLADVDEPERKRKIIGAEFIEVFAEAAAKVDAPFLGQGSIYPDFLESIPLDGDPKGVIKSHHNVGGLPEKMDFQLVEPLARLFKDEVREVGRLLGLPEVMIDRQPFPGPSLGVRCVGEIRREYLRMLREADAIFIEELRASGWYAKTWQAFAAFLPVRSVGMHEGQRRYGYTIALRAITTTDAVTAQVVHLPWELLEKVACRIPQEVEGISRVVIDCTPKPPATIEWE